MMLAALSMDPKTLQAMGIDPKKLNALAQPATSKSGDSKTKANSTLDPMLLAAFGMDPKNPKLDPITRQHLVLIQRTQSLTQCSLLALDSIQKIQTQPFLQQWLLWIQIINLLL